MTWYVLHVRSRTEKKLAAVCQRHAISYYLPLREEIKIYQRRKVRVEKPLFPGYVFACLGPDVRIHVQRTNYIVQMLVPADERKLVFELEQVRQALVADPGLVAVRGVAEGQRVRIKAGVFVGVEGIVVKWRGKLQVRIQVDMIGQSVPLDVDPDFLETLEAP